MEQKGVEQRLTTILAAAEPYRRIQTLSNKAGILPG
jgi:hypothetical protein